jgi:hypothetical protein
MTRSKAYSWLARELSIAESACHMSLLSNEQLTDVATLCSSYLKNNEKALIRRKEKRNARQAKARERSTAQRAVRINRS